MSNYENGLIYKLCCKDANITYIYIGSTTSFRHRKAQHKNCCYNENKRGYNCHVYKFIRDNGNWENWDMVLVEYYPCKTKLELEKREREIIEELKPTLNKQIPTRTIKEWHDDNKEKLLEERKIYYETNKEKIKEQKKEWRDVNKEKIKEKAKEYYEENKEKIKEKTKEHYENNKEKLLEQKKEYRQNNKEQIAEKLKEKVTCECGSIIRKDTLSKHIKTIKHSKYIILKNNIDNI